MYYYYSTHSNYLPQLALVQSVAVDELLQIVDILMIEHLIQESLHPFMTTLCCLQFLDQPPIHHKVVLTKYPRSMVLPGYFQMV